MPGGKPFGVLGPLLLLVACSDPFTGFCSRDPDCPGGQRCADGVCTPVLPPVEAGPLEARPEARLDAGPDRRPADAGSGDGSSVCQPNQDDRIDRIEMPIRVGASIKYTSGSGLTLDLQGSQVAGRTTWDLTAAASDDHPYLAELEPVASWAAADFAGATYMTLLDAGYQTYGVFKASPAALQLIGVISRTANDTKLKYSTPIDTLRFPITVTDSFETGAVVTGPMDFFPYYASIYETYTVDVLAAGTVKLPELSLDALLVRVVVKQNPTANPFLITTRLSYLFVSECYGIIAQIFAEASGDPLTAVKAKERRRISK